MDIKRHVIISELFDKPISIAKENNLSIEDFKTIVRQATVGLHKQGLTMVMVSDASREFKHTSEDTPLAVIAMKTISEFFRA